MSLQSNHIQTHSVFNDHLSRWTWVSQLTLDSPSALIPKLHPSGTGQNFPCQPWYNPTKTSFRVPKSGYLTITKIENLHINSHTKIRWFQKCYSFRSTTKNNKVIVEKTFQNSGVTRRLWHFQHITVLEWSIEVGFSLILLIYKDVYISIKRLACRICGNTLEKSADKFAKN